MLNLYDLTVDYQKEPKLTPLTGLRFGWKLSSEKQNVIQKTARILVCDGGTVIGDTGIIESNRNFDVCPMLPALEPMKEYSFTVEVTDNQGEGAKASLAFITAPTEEDWQGAEWIRPARHISGWAPYLRTRFETKDVTKAVMYACGLGCAEYYINGARTDDYFVDPPITNYEEQVMYRRWDVTDMIRDGGNALCVLLGEGFYAQSRVWGHNGMVYGKECVRLMLFITHKDGSVERIITKPDTWKSCLSPISVNNIYAGETYDCRLEVDGYADYDSSDDGWTPCVIDETKKGAMTPCNIPPVRILRELPAVSVKCVSGKDDGAWIFDLGENFAGICEFRIPHSPRGAVYVFRFAETLNEAGALDVRSTGSFATQCIQQEIYICRGDADGEVYRPRFCYHGFRFVEMTGFHDFSQGYGTMPWTSIVTGLQLTTDMPQTGSFHTSYEELDRFCRLMENTYRSNFHGIPEDCPAREKCGWLGDAQVCANYGMLNYDSVRAYEKYLDDIRTTCKVYGTWQMISPGKRGCGEATPLWGCAQIIIPYYLWRYYGDSEAVTRNFDQMEAWIQHEVNRAKDYIIDEGLGDWDPAEGNNGPRRMPVIHSSTLMFYEISTLMAEICSAFGMGDPEKYADLAAKIKAAMIDRFWDDEKHTYGYWGTDGVALETGLYPDGAHDALLAQILDRIEKDEYAMPTGIYANKYLVPALMERGHADVAYDFLFNHEKRSFATMLDDNATTVWETPDMNFVERNTEIGVSSYDHPMHGGFLYTIYTHAAGLMPLQAGYQKFAFAPCRSKKTGHIDASVESPLGKLAVEIDNTETGRSSRLTIPANAVCVLRLPDAKKIILDGTEVPFGTCIGSGVHTVVTEE